MWLSLLQGNKTELIRRGLRDGYDWHQTLWKMFPEQEERVFLFRVEDDEADSRVYLLSVRQPQFGSWAGWQSKEVADSFLSHQRYYFRLRANPTIKRIKRLEDGTRKKNGYRSAIYDEKGLREWLARKGEQSGFRTQEGEVIVTPPQRQYSSRKGDNCLHSSAEFSGVLSVCDPALFQAAWQNGIGGGRAFGFGLLLLKPAL